ncbi:MAG: pyridoxal-phosphate dependent enzyme [Taibaiella sp.]|nr:pyridoxal-phosphate dependent enzyme [Taibaiella sp.]
MDIINEGACIVQPLSPGWYNNRVAGIDMLRLDAIHPIISGNKWFKLKLNIAHALKEGSKGVLTFGGAYSNHLVATAAAARENNLSSVGIVRGLHHQHQPTDTLLKCVAYGMQLKYITIQEYRHKTDEEWLIALSAQYADHIIIPEGGANEEGRMGAGEIAQHIPACYTHICLPVGTGTTLAGIRNALPEAQEIIGFAPLKGGDYLNEALRPFIHKANWHITDRWHLGGFGKHGDELITFMNDFYGINKIPLDIIYTGKMMVGLHAMVAENYFSPDAHILCIHTGGLQGNTSVSERLCYAGS